MPDKNARRESIVKPPTGFLSSKGLRPFFFELFFWTGISTVNLGCSLTGEEGLFPMLNFSGNLPERGKRGDANFSKSLRPWLSHPGAIV